MYWPALPLSTKIVSIQNRNTPVIIFFQLPLLRSGIFYPTHPTVIKFFNFSSTREKKNVNLLLFSKIFYPPLSIQHQIKTTEDMVTTSNTSNHQCKVKLNWKVSAALRKMGKKKVYIQIRVSYSLMVKFWAQTSAGPWSLTNQTLIWITWLI